MFDSQNNAKGGYACPRGVGGPDRDSDGEKDKMYYYTGSQIPIEWTQQHGGGIGNGKLESVVIIEYATTETLDPTGKYDGPAHVGAPRDGIPRDNNDAATDTIPNNEDNGPATSVENRRFGMHETVQYYQEMCVETQRNKGLFNADQRVRRNDARGTRQNPNGNRRGLECPSERDYFPYWQPTPWVPIAILTSNPNRCGFYKEHFQKKNFGYCEVKSGSANNKYPALNVNCTTRQGSEACCPSGSWKQGATYREKMGESIVPEGWFVYNKDGQRNSDTERERLMWNNFDCVAEETSRVNHLGNAQNIVDNDNLPNNGNDIVGQPGAVDQSPANRYIWTVPDIPTDGIVIRVRYNMSTLDYEVYASGGERNGVEVSPLSSSCGGVTKNDFWDTNLPCYSPAVSEVVTDAESNGKEKSPVLQDPYVELSPGENGEATKKFVSLAVNTNQYGRTFQDRSYRFGVKPISYNDGDDGLAKRLAKFSQYDPERYDLTNNNRAKKDDADVIAGQLNGVRFCRNALEATSERLSRGQGNAAQCSLIANLNTRGKRGNIVQTYPAVEYDFTPNRLKVETNDFVHFQWTGSDYNPRRGCNDAEGGPPDPPEDGDPGKNSRADRSNLLEVESMAQNYPRNYTYNGIKTATMLSSTGGGAAKTMFAASNGACDDVCLEEVMWVGMLMGGLQSDKQDASQCKTEEELEAIKNKNQRENDNQNCAKINNIFIPYFDAGPIKMRTRGRFKYYSSRNNNFSNRDQTGTLCVGDSCAIKDSEELASLEGIKSSAFASQLQLADDVLQPVTEDEILEADTTNPENGVGNDARGL